MTRSTRSKQPIQQLPRYGQQPKTSVRDAIRLLLALVFILFASIASREHDSPEKTLEAQEVAQSHSSKHLRSREESHSAKIPDTSVLSRINGSI